MHYARVLRHGAPDVRMVPGGWRRVDDPVPTCSVEGCDDEAVGGGLCSMHYMRQRRRGEVGCAEPQRVPERGCSVVGCDRSHKAKGYCEMHWRRVRSTGEPGTAVGKKDRHERDGWVVRGLGFTTNGGYRGLVCPEHPNANANGHVLEHRFVMSNHLGRALADDEVVHHRNGDRADNRIENLELVCMYHGKGQCVDDRVAAAVRVLERYAPERLA